MANASRIVLTTVLLLIAGCSSPAGEPAPPAEPTDTTPPRPIEGSEGAGDVGGGRDGVADAEGDGRVKAPGGIRFDAAVTTMTGCPALRGVDCFEPTVAADAAGRLFSAPGGGQAMVASLDGGMTWGPRNTPDLHSLALVPAHLGDNTLQVDPLGRLWFSRLVYLENNFGQNVAGFQVARSDDGGETWPVSEAFAWNDLSPDPVVGADRQWVSFGAGETVYAQYWQFHTGTHWMAASDDGGETFGPLRPTPATITGPALVAGDGAVHLVHFLFGSPYEVQVSTSTDGGANWATETAFRSADGEANGPLQILPAIDGAGALHILWGEADGSVLLLSGRPGSWGTPMAWNVGPAVPASPIVRAHDGVLDALWFEENGTGQDVVFAWAPVDRASSGPVERVVLETLPSADKVTDFAWLDSLPDGRAVVTWTHHELGVRVAVESGR